MGTDCACRNCTLGRGTCVREPHGTGFAFGDCKCEAGWGRKDCFCVAGCAESKHGTCRPSDGACVCDKDWTGATCDQPYCANNCSNHGECIVDQIEASMLFD